MALEQGQAVVKGVRVPDRATVRARETGAKAKAKVWEARQVRALAGRQQQLPVPHPCPLVKPRPVTGWSQLALHPTT